MSGKIAIIFGTRPEAIKLAPIISMLNKHPDLKPLVISTGQHKEMLAQMVSLFKIKIDYSLDLMSENQNLSSLTSAILTALHPIYEKEKPAAVLTQGDTTTAFAASLSAFYHKIPVGHVEAGLRSNQRYSPFPEEINRKLISSLCHWSFTPTQDASDNLLREGFPSAMIHHVGNTVVDALYHVLENKAELHPVVLKTLSTGKKLILMTFHRREQFGDGFLNVCGALKTIAQKHPDVDILYPVHLNPSVHKIAHEQLQNFSNIILTEPLAYSDLVHAMRGAHIVLTDSGGIQEEAPVLGKPVLVMRDVTERPEGVKAGVARLVGTCHDTIVREVSQLLDDAAHYKTMSRAESLYGDGNSGERIVNILANDLVKVEG